MSNRARAQTRRAQARLDMVRRGPGPGMPGYARVCPGPGPVISRHGPSRGHHGASGGIRGPGWARPRAQALGPGTRARAPGPGPGPTRLTAIVFHHFFQCLWTLDLALPRLIRLPVQSDLPKTYEWFHELP